MHGRCVVGAWSGARNEAVESGSADPTRLFFFFFFKHHAALLLLFALCLEEGLAERRRLEGEQRGGELRGRGGAAVVF